MNYAIAFEKNGSSTDRLHFYSMPVSSTIGDLAGGVQRIEIERGNLSGDLVSALGRYFGSKGTIPNPIDSIKR